MKWEYQIVPLQAQVLSDLLKALTAAGPEGWELVTIIPHPMPTTSVPPQSTAIFKRPVAGSDLDGRHSVTVNVNVSPGGTASVATAPNI